MARTLPKVQWQRSIVLLTATVIGAAVVITLYWAQVVLVPVALAVFLMFLLTPPIRWLEKRGQVGPRRSPPWSSFAWRCVACWVGC